MDPDPFEIVIRGGYCLFRHDTYLMVVKRGEKEAASPVSNVSEGDRRNPATATADSQTPAIDPAEAEKNHRRDGATPDLITNFRVERGEAARFDRSAEGTHLAFVVSGG